MTEGTDPAHQEAGMAEIRRAKAIGISSALAPRIVFEYPGGNNDDPA